jgi:hypothetical protein
LNLDRSRITSAFLSMALIELVIVGALAMTQTDQDRISLNETSGQIVKIGAIYNLEGQQSPWIFILPGEPGLQSMRSMPMVGSMAKKSS